MYNICNWMSSKYFLETCLSCMKIKKEAKAIQKVFFLMKSSTIYNLLWDFLYSNLCLYFLLTQGSTNCSSNIPIKPIISRIYIFDLGLFPKHMISYKNNYNYSPFKPSRNKISINANQLKYLLIVVEKWHWSYIKLKKIISE